MLLLNNGSSMKSQRPSRITTGSLTHLTFSQTEDQAMSDAQLPTQDGGNSSSTKVLQLSMREERSLRFKAMSIKRTETLESTLKRMESTSNGTSCTLTNGRVNLKRVSSMRNSVFMLKEISMLFLNCQITDILISLTTEIWSLKHQTVEDTKSGTSINNP